MDTLDRRALERLRRGRLYGCGHGAVLPRLDRSAASHPRSKLLQGWSVAQPPLHLSSAQRQGGGVEAKASCSSYEHDTVMAHRNSSCADPDKAYFGKVGPRLPWFLGYRNKIMPTPPGENWSCRYGPRGAASLSQWVDSHDPWSVRKSVTAVTPGFLARGLSEVNEYVPKLEAKPTFANTPGLWPEDSRYVAGFVGNNACCASSTSSMQSTISSKFSMVIEDPEAGESLPEVPVADHNQLTDALPPLPPLVTEGPRVNISRSSIPSGAGNSHTRRCHRRQKQVRTLASLGNERRRKFQDHVTKYSGTSTIVMNPGSLRHLRTECTAGDLDYRYHLKLTQIKMVNFFLVYTDTGTGSFSFTRMARALFAASAQTGILCADTFVEVLTKYIPECSKACAYRTYSSFDPFRTSEVEYARILSPLLILGLYRLRTPSMKILQALRKFLLEHCPASRDLWTASDVLFMLLCSCALDKQQDDAMRVLAKHDVYPRLIKLQSSANWENAKDTACCGQNPLGIAAQSDEVKTACIPENIWAEAFRYSPETIEMYTLQLGEFSKWMQAPSGV